MDELAELEQAGGFVRRHIGPSEADLAAMLRVVGAATLDDVAAKAVPPAIRSNQALDLPDPVDEAACIAELRVLAAENVVKKSLIGMGYHGTVTPPVILRNVLENPGWYTAYTPYQAEIAQGRLEALLNFQTMICELTGMPIANASLLDEATAAAEAMAMAHALSKSKSDVLAVAADLHPQTLAVLATRAKPLGITLKLVPPGDLAAIGAANAFALVLQYPGTTGEIRNLSEEITAAHEIGALAIVATDLLALALLTPPGEMGADIVVGSSQRFGVPMGLPTCGGLCHARRLQARDAGPACGRFPGCRWAAGDAACAANARAAYPPREGDIEHLHGAGSAGCHGRILRGMARAGGTAPHCPPGFLAGADAGGLRAAGWTAAAAR